MGGPIIITPRRTTGLNQNWFMTIALHFLDGELNRRYELLRLAILLH